MFQYADDSGGRGRAGESGGGRGLANWGQGQDSEVNGKDFRIYYSFFASEPTNTKYRLQVPH